MIVLKTRKSFKINKLNLLNPVNLGYKSFQLCRQGHKDLGRDVSGIPLLSPRRQETFLRVLEVMRIEMNALENRWTRREDELFRKLVNSRASSKSIARTLNRTEDELKKRGYLLGLPLKWFRQAAAGS